MQVVEFCVETRECEWVGACWDERQEGSSASSVGAGRSIPRRLQAHLTDHASPDRLGPVGHRRGDLVFERVVVWTRLGVRVTRGRQGSFTQETQHVLKRHNVYSRDTILLSPPKKRNH